ncbi:MAG TPA: hypothetical protein IAC50_06730 [Candidatus Copromorpha excrementigallinarum]|uniref:Catalase immune-responsive domain-containing protein n=1 Tax=Candidatus Allocopromorpha excrementigallinarum TaxID=2840742 RepID=A0A9D1L7I2_9FIRM|nr:hypothetical protein [Candidatus Copromorpha excrementigallinarum]
MKEFYQAGRFYRSLSPEEREDLAEAVAENIFFLDEELQEKVVLLLEKADRELGNKVKEKNRR